MILGTHPIFNFSDPHGPRILQISNHSTSLTSIPIIADLPLQNLLLQPYSNPSRDLHRLPGRLHHTSLTGLIGDPRLVDVPTTPRRWRPASVMTCGWEIPEPNGHVVLGNRNSSFSPSSFRGTIDHLAISSYGIIIPWYNSSILGIIIPLLDELFKRPNGE